MGTTGRSLLLASLILMLLHSAEARADNSNVPTKKTRDRAVRVMDSLLPGPPEIPSITDSPKTDVAQSDRCACREKNGLEKGIASLTGGIWQLATFWYPVCPHASDSKTDKP